MIKRNVQGCQARYSGVKRNLFIGPKSNFAEVLGLQFRVFSSSSEGSICLRLIASKIVECRWLICDWKFKYPPVISISDDIAEQSASRRVGRNPAWEGYEVIRYSRKYSLFSLCGLNCGLCPRYQTDGPSKCPGCGGEDFHVKHPSCAVISCNRKHDNVEYCFQCSSYPCDRYKEPSQLDSFITYRNVISDFKKANDTGLAKYQKELDGKVNILEYLIKNYDDGRRKSFYCLAVNLLKLSDLNEIIEHINKKIKNQEWGIKEKIRLVIDLLELQAKKEKIELKLRK